MVVKCIKLTASQINYLTALYTLDSGGSGVRCVDIAKELSISKPSVHTMMITFEKIGFISKTRYGNVYLSETGRLTAELYGEAYKKLRGFFGQTLGVSDSGVSRSVLAMLSELTVTDIQNLCDRIIKMNGSANA